MPLNLFILIPADSVCTPLKVALSWGWCRDVVAILYVDDSTLIVNIELVILHKKVDQVLSQDLGT